MQGADMAGDYGGRVLGDPGKFRFVHLNAQLAAQDLVKRSDIISKAVADDNLTIVSAFYSLEDGSVSFHD